MSRTSPVAVIFIAVTIAFTVIGQLLVKKGMLEVGRSPGELSLLPRFAFTTFTNPFVLAGLICAVIAAFSWTVAVSRSALSFAYPFMSLAIVLVLVLSGVLFGEAVPINRWIGVALVCVALLIAS